MSENAGHIISRFRWDTSFGRKDRAAELQERLSSWSRFNMPGEIDDVFNKLCPREQTWKIQSLELDLGIIDYNNLEFELAGKLRRQLHEKLIDMLIYSNRGVQQIEILDENTSHIHLISSFLLTGLMPWNYKPADGSVNQILTYQLQNNRHQVIAMIREVAVVHEDVRKRVAWQINEPSIIKIIEGLEPGNSPQIISFSDELTKIQVKETIVQASVADFKKQLWLWILNFLFTERGTIFNKVAFMRSTIRQMAEHYNISYDELFEMIQLAVERVSKHYTLKADFLVTLKALSKENQLTKAEIYHTAEDQKDHWQRLIKYFRDHSSIHSEQKKIEFNELVIGLSRSYPQKFSEIALSAGYTENLWSQAIDVLDDASLEVIISALNAGSSASLTAHIYFLDKLSRQINLKIERKVLWKIGVKYLFSYKTSSFDSLDFINYGVLELSKQYHLPKEQLLDRLTSAKIPSSAKTTATLDIYTNLVAIHTSDIAQGSTAFSADGFKRLIEAIGSQLNRRTISKDEFVSLQKLLVKNIRLYPGRILEVLMEYPHKDQLRKVLTFIIDKHLAHLLLTHTNKKEPAILFAVRAVLSGFKEDKKNNALAELVEDNLVLIGLDALIFYPALTPAKFLEVMLGKLAKLVPAVQAEQFALLNQMIFASAKLRSLGISAVNAAKIIELQAIAGKQFNIQHIAQILNTSALRNKQAEISKILIANFTNKEFVQLRRDGKKESIIILNYLLTRGEELMNTLVKEYTLLLSRELKQLSKQKIALQLTELYWNCLLDSAAHSAGVDRLKRSFKLAVLFRFPVSSHLFPSDFSPGRLNGVANKTYQLNSGKKIANHLLFFLIEQCLTTGNTEIIYAEDKFYLREMIDIALELNPGELRRIMAKMPATEKQVAIIKAAVPFTRFILWIGNDATGVLNEAARSISTLYELVSPVASGETAVKLLDTFWQELWRLIKTNTWLAGDLKKLVQYSFQLIAAEKRVNTDVILSEIEKKQARLSPQLSSALAEYLPAFSKLSISEITKLPTAQLLKAEQKGLLYELAFHVVSEKQVPVWYSQPGKQEPEDLLNEMVIHYPATFFLVLKRAVISEPQMLWLSQSLNFKALIRSIGSFNKDKYTLLSILEEFHRALGNITMSGIPAKEIQHILFKKVIKAWTTNNWRLVSTENIWNELVWDVCVKKGVSKKEFVKDIQKVKTHFPPSLQISFEYLKDEPHAPVIIPDKAIITKPIISKPLQKHDAKLPAKTGIYVRNAGLVLVNSYIPLLFKRLGFTVKEKFVNETIQADAVHYLQYVVTGLSRTEESWLPLNKLLCGLPLSQPVTDGIVISEDDKVLIEGLISAIIGYWPSIGNCSVDGFRGNWLVRDGLLIEHTDKWELTVEKRAYDLLINKSPFSFSIIKYPWMNKPLHVSWPY